MKSIAHFLRTMMAVSLFGIAQASAQDASTTQDASPNLIVDLNALQETDRGCRFTFVVTNNLGGELTSAAFELVLFDKAGMVSRITIVDFKDLPEGKTKVRQFNFSGIKCDSLGRILINDTTECAGTGIDAKACISHLKTETRTETAFGV